MDLRNHQFQKQLRYVLPSFSFIEAEGIEYLAKELIKIGANFGQFVDIKKLLPSRKTISNYVDS
jgi:hypothetical protein